MAKKLFVAGLSWDTTDSTLREFFSKVGQVESANVVTDKFTGRSRGFGFVEMASDEEADKAKSELSGQSLDGRTITVDEARPREDRPRGDRPSSGGFQRRDNNRGGGFNRDRGGRGR